MLLGPSQSRHTKPLKGFDKFKDCIFFKKKKKKKGYIFTLRVRSDTILRLRFLQSWLMVDRVNASKNMHDKIRHPLQKTRSRCGKTGGWREHRPAAACEGSSTAHTHTHFTLVFIPARQQAQTALVVPMMSQPIKSCLSLSLIFYLRLN